MEESAKKNLTLKELGERTDRANQIDRPFSDVVSDLKAGFLRDFTVEQACHYAKIRKDTYYRWLKESDEFAEQMAIARSDFLRKSKKIVIDAIDKGDIDTAKWLLERREKKNYSPRQELTGEEGESIKSGITVTFIDGS